MLITKPGGITIGQLELNTSALAGTPFTVVVYARLSTYVGAEQSSGQWIQVSTGAGVAAGLNQPSRVDLVDVNVPAAPFGACIVIQGAAHAYTLGTGTNQAFANSDLALTLGAATAGAFSGAPTSPVVWNGRLLYDCAPSVPQPFCGAGSSTNGCPANITGSAQPSATLATPCVILVNLLEGQRQGVIFYGINNTGFSPSPWAPNSSSLLCVKSPTLRTGVQNSGGTPLTCDGLFTLDWNAFQAANPGSLGQPFATGEKVFVQAWYRDPLAAKATNLSNAIEMTMQP
ncbi:MAG: hypothetical protein NTV21_05140 [Planctomycetota bacterium]|nr:hypothetical protein [Planctomycetota bacterium]